PPVFFGRAGRPSHFQEWKLFNSHSLVTNSRCPMPDARCPIPKKSYVCFWFRALAVGESS
ncbi:hypothetical protein, partial [Microcoleus sp. B9-D4]|uniref:hypothetical protein n=1 Tax=Microcoleus sp. B9-D4 TaxID=2818711 RepID=UPI002FD6F628